MTPSRHVLPFFAAVVAIAAGSRAAVAVASDPVPAEDQAASSDDPDAEASGEDAAVAAPMPATFVDVSGGVSGALPSSGEARTTWRYGRARGVPVDETTNRLRVSGAGRTLDGLRIGFSVALLTPALRPGTYAAGAVTGVAGAWARRSREGNPATMPDIEWDTSAVDAGPASFAVTVTSVAETSHSSDRRGGVTVDVTDYRVHGSIEATLPCTRTVAALRPSCRPVAIRGTF